MFVACCIPCTSALYIVSITATIISYVACVQITASALMSSRPAFLPLCCAANCFSQALRSFRSVLQRCSSSVMLIMECVVYRVWFNDDLEGRIQDRGTRRARARAKASRGLQPYQSPNHFNEHVHANTSTTLQSFEQALHQIYYRILFTTPRSRAR